uniref:Uncharacterized protein n=1 Tax=Daphnia galeata TaxID=27404 RepID=A0A8J2RQW7_9CRUS|nr:unnamed protein product [Daphnia galeata]
MSSRSRSPDDVASANIFNISGSKSRQVRKWIVQGLPNSEAKELRLKFKPVFEGSFDLFCPKLDESMERGYVEVNSISDDGLNATNAACLEPDESGRPVIEQYRILSPFNRLCLQKRFQIAA